MPKPQLMKRLEPHLAASAPAAPAANGTSAQPVETEAGHVHRA